MTACSRRCITRLSRRRLHDRTSFGIAHNGAADSSMVNASDSTASNVNVYLLPRDNGPVCHDVPSDDCSHVAEAAASAYFRPANDSALTCRTVCFVNAFDDRFVDWPNDAIVSTLDGRSTSAQRSCDDGTDGVTVDNHAKSRFASSDEAGVPTMLYDVSSCLEAALMATVPAVMLDDDFLSSIGLPLNRPILTYEDSQTTIRTVLANRVSPTLRHLDCMIRILHEWYAAGHFVPGFTSTDLMLADDGVSDGSVLAMLDTDDSLMPLHSVVLAMTVFQMARYFMI
jgi:hypothetical protein